MLFPFDQLSIDLFRNGSGRFIRETFGFNDFFKKGKSHYYRKSSIIRLSQEFKSRNVDLTRYMELKESEAKFQEKVSAVIAASKKQKTKPVFQLPDSLRDINTMNLSLRPEADPSFQVLSKTFDNRVF